MSRLWEKGLPLDERVLRYTAGEDHELDARLVPYDVRGSIAHAEMLAAQELISREDCHEICDGLRDLQKSFEAGEWQLPIPAKCPAAYPISARYSQTLWRPENL